MENINKKYDDMLKLASEINPSEKEKNTELTDAQVEELAHVLEGAPVSPDTKLYQDIINTDHGEQETEKSIDIPIINPRNGLHVMSNSVEDSKSSGVNYNTNINIDDIMSLDVDADLTSVDVDKDHVMKTINSVYPGIKISDSDMLTLIDLSNRYNRGEKMSYYNSMPEDIKKNIDMILGQTAPTMGAYHKEGRNQIAEALLDMIVDSAITDSAINDMNIASYNTAKELSDAAEEGMSAFFKMQREQYEVNYLNQAEKYYKAIENGEVKDEDIEEITKKAKNYKESSISYIEAYTYNTMMEVFRTGKLKVKPIQIQKFKRTCDEFNYKYAKSNLSVNDLRLTVPALDRHLNKDEDISMDDIYRFIAVFVNYTRNMSPSNIGEHVFMYYFIKNILNLDMYNHSDADEEEFYTGLVHRIEECIKEIKSF